MSKLSAKAIDEKAGATVEQVEHTAARRRAHLALARNILLAAALMVVTVWCWPLLVEAVLPVYDWIAHVVTVMWGWLS